MRSFLVLGLLLGSLLVVGCAKEETLADQPKPDLSRDNPGRPDPHLGGGAPTAPAKRAKGAD